jgi:hypothetical protein
MTPTDFVHWMRGFVTACPKFHPTPEQWDLLKDQLQKVETPETKTMQTGPIHRTGYAQQMPNGTFETNPAVNTSGTSPSMYTFTTSNDSLKETK